MFAADIMRSSASFRTVLARGLGFLHHLEAEDITARPCLIPVGRPVEKGEGGSFPGPRDVWGPHLRSKILKMVLQMASF